MQDDQQAATRSLEAEYFLRLSRVGAVVLTLAVAGYFVLRSQQQPTPPAPVAEGVPLILLENATISEDSEAIERAPDFVRSTDPAADAARDVLAGQPLVAPTVRVDLPAAPPLSAQPLLAPESPIFEIATTEVAVAEPEKKKPDNRKP